MWSWFFYYSSFPQASNVCELLCFFHSGHLWDRWKSGFTSVHVANHVQPIAPPHLKQQRLHFIHPDSNNFPPGKQLNLYRISPCSSSHGALTQHTRSNCSAGKPGHRQSTSPVSQRTQYHKKRVRSALFKIPLQFSLCRCLCYIFNSTRNTCLGQAHLQNISEPPIEITNYSVCLADFATVFHSCLKERLRVVSHAEARAWSSLTHMFL